MQLLSKDGTENAEERAKALAIHGAPPTDIVKGFGTTDPPVLLDGGQGQTYRSGNIVLKPSDEDAAWIAEIQATIVDERFRMPRPLKSIDGKWVYKGWALWSISKADTSQDAGKKRSKLVCTFTMQYLLFPNHRS